jgi:hypothetical protein
MGVWDSFTDQSPQNREKQAACPREGAACPRCQLGTLSYNGKLELVCSACRAVFSAGFT